MTPGIAAAQSDAIVTVIHGIPGEDLGLDPELPVDVFVDEVGCALEDFRFGDVSPRLALPAGTYTVSVRLSDPDAGPCGGATAIGPAPIPVDEGENATIIAHLTEDGAPTASKYTNRVEPAMPGDARIAVHHDAAVGAVDIRLYQLYPWTGSDPVIELEGVVNPQSADADLPAGLALATISPAGGKPVAFEFVNLPEDQTTLLYATGSLTNGTFALLADVQDLIVPEQPVGVATVTVIHGIPGDDLGLASDLPVDVSISGLGCALTGFRFGDITGRLSVPEGSYDIEIRLTDADAGPCAGPLAVSAPGVPFEAGENATVLAHLDEAGAPTAAKFVNDLSDPGRRRNARLAVHHAAAVGAVDVSIYKRLWIWLFRVARLDDVTNGQSASLARTSGKHLIKFTPAGGRPSAYERSSSYRESVNVTRNQATLVYAVGSPENDTFQLIVDRQSLD
jgi:hypothetical protein